MVTPAAAAVRLTLATAVALAAATAAAQAPKASPRPAAPGTVITIVAYNHFYEAPNPITAGLVTFRFVNRGPDLHQMWIVKIDEGYAFSDFMNAIRPGRPMPNWLRGLGGPESPESGDEVSVTMQLEPGRYALACFIPTAEGGSHLSKGMFLPLTVLPAKGKPAPAPKDDGSIMIRDNGVEVNGAVSAGKHLMRVESTGSMARGARIARILDGKSWDDVMSWVSNGGGSANAPVKLLGGVTPLASGAVNWVALTLAKGDYAVLPMSFAIGSGNPEYVPALAKKFSVR
ncbi:MAG: hypothetical protein HY275_04345 [Gemmatimonadetes bacterium]|nr:hypothetical protein [Gemmatimonadota bacterium]